MTAGARLTALETRDLSTLSALDANAALRDLSVIKGKTAQLEAAIARRVTELAATGDALPAADVLGRNGKTSRKDAEKVERRSNVLGETPHLNNALGDGRVGNEHADALAGAASRLDDEHRNELFGRDQEITELATSHTPETFRRRLATIINDITRDNGLDRAAQQDNDASASVKTDNDTGMHHLFARLTPEQGNRIRRRLDHEIASIAKLEEFAGLRRDQLMARALERLICGTQTSSAMGPAELAVHIDLHTLTTGHHDASVCEYSDGTPIPIETARRHACDAKIIPIVLNGKSMPLDVGRASRLATPAQRIALRSMYRTCAIDGCDKHFDLCHIHHLDEWDHHGPTNLNNLLPLCSHHHHRAHEGRWQLQLHPSTRQLTVHHPNGTLHSTALPDLLEQQNDAA